MYLLLRSPPSALGQLGVIVHRGGSATGRLSILPPFRIQHPPGAFSCSLILDAHETTVQRQVVSDGVLGTTKGITVI